MRGPNGPFPIPLYMIAAMEGNEEKECLCATSDSRDEVSYNRPYGPHQDNRLSGMNNPGPIEDYHELKRRSSLRVLESSSVWNHYWYIGTQI